MQFLTLSVILCFVSCIAFAVVVLVFNANGIDVSDSLIEWFFKVFGVEFAAAAAIRISKYTIEKAKTKDKIKLIKENDLPLDKEDLTVSDDEDYDFEDGTVFYG